MGQDAATCVAVDVRPSASAATQRLVEGALGWQVVALDDAVLPAACVLVDVGTAGVHAAGPVPRLLVVERDDPPRAVAEAARGVAGVVGPDPRPDELAAAVDRLAARPRAAAPWRVVGASAGGVGATTVAAAVAGLRAWAAGPTLLVASGPPHVAGAPLLHGEDLATPAVWEAAAPAAALPPLRVVAWEPAPGLPVVAGSAAVLETGPVDPALQPVDVLVVRPDRTGLDAVGAACATPAVVVVGTGPVSLRVLRAAAPGPVLALPRSARVANATAAGRLPAGLPGRWLDVLRPLLDPVGGTP